MGWKLFGWKDKTCVQNLGREISCKSATDKIVKGMQLVHECVH
jgi:hypothetical protein